MFIATLIAADRLSRGDISAAQDRLSGAGCAPTGTSMVQADIAGDIMFGTDPAAARAALEDAFAGIDVVVQPTVNRVKRLLVADMDSTMITVECIDELADYAGLRAEISEVTERAMRGELDFEAALTGRVALLAGLGQAVLAQCHAERVRIMPGAIPLVRTMRARGGRAVLVSGGFTHFADKVAADIGFDRAVSNRLGISGGKLDGTVALPIVGAEGKREELLRALVDYGIDPVDSMAIGDGANDIPMIREAGLGIAYHAKPVTETAADAVIRFGDLGALLYAQGIPRSAWVTT